MYRTMRFNHTIPAIGIPLLLMLSMVLLSQSSWFQQHPENLSFAITIDLLLTVPLVYLFLIWKKTIPKTTAVPFFIAGLVLGSYIIPAGYQSYLDLAWQWVVPVVELAVFTLVVLKVRAVLKSYNTKKKESLDFHTLIKQVCGEVLPGRVDKILAFEISVIYYGFVNWKRRKLQANEFSYHKKTGTIAVLAILIGIIWVETAVTHLLLQRWSPLAAWMLTVLSLYSGFQIFGMLRSLSKRPIRIEKDALLLRYGIMSEATILLKDIDAVVLSSKQQSFDHHTRKLSPLADLESHNVLIHLKKQAILEGLYGFKKTCTTIALHIDEKERFKLVMEKAVSG